MPRRRIKLRSLVALLVLASFVPLGALSTWLVLQSWHRQVAVVERQNVDTARAVSVAVDERIRRAITALRTLATAPSLLGRDFAGFRVRAEEQPKIHDWTAVLVADSSGEVLMDTAGPAGEGGDLAPLGELERRLLTGAVEAAVSPLHGGAAAERHWVLVAVPVTVQDRVSMVLAARIDARAVGRVLAEQNVPPGGVVTLIDQDLHIIARTRNAEQLVGKLPTPGFQAAARRLREGNWRDNLLEGTPAYSALSRSELTGWTVGIGVACEEIDAPLRRSLLALLGLGAGLLLVGLGLAFVLGRRIVDRLGVAAAAARALARGEPVAPPPSRIVELDDLGAALGGASSLLRDRLDQRDAAERARAAAAADRERALLAEREARTSLARELLRLDVTLRSIADAVVATDAVDCVLVLNRAAQLLTGWSEAEAVGQPRARVLPLLDEATRQPLQPRGGEWPAAALLGARDGRELPVELSAAPIGAGDEAPVGHVFVCRDVSERRADEQRRRDLLQQEQQARRAAEALNRSKDEFLAMLAHELRNPLAPILHMAQVLKQQQDPATAPAAVVIERQVRHMARLVEDLLDVARITGGRIRLRQQPVVLADALQQAVEVVLPSVRHKQQELQFEPPPRELVVQGDPERLAQVFGNLLHNASKFTPAGGHLALEVEVAGDAVEIAVCDDGRGLEPSQLGEVFEAFRQIDTALDRSEGGLGIGLTLVKRLVEKHGGTVVAHSEGLGRGCTFTVRLPLQPAAAAPAAAAEPAAAAGRKVLVIDDNRDAADCLAHLLRLRGHEARTAYRGAEALATAAEFAPDVALVDIGLPDMDGYALARALRDREADSARLRLVALSGYGHDRERALAAGFDAHLMKPVEEAVLDAALR